MDYFNNPKFRVEFEGSCLNLDKETFVPNKNCFVCYLWNQIRVYVAMK